VARGNQLSEILHGAKAWINGIIVNGIVFMIGTRGKYGIKINAVDSKVLYVIQVLNYTPKGASQPALAQGSAWSSPYIALS
jgi:hypothetical protein